MFARSQRDFNETEILEEIEEVVQNVPEVKENYNFCGSWMWTASVKLCLMNVMSVIRKKKKKLK